MSVATVSTLSLGVFQFLNTLGRRIFDSQKDNSLTTFTKAARVEPITMVDSRLDSKPYLSDILMTLNSLYAGYYMQAVALHTTISKIDVLGTLGKFNPAGQDLKIASAKSGSLFSNESYSFSLPRVKESFGLENFGLSPYEQRQVYASLENKGDKTPPAQRNPTSADTTKDLVQSAPLSVGRMIEVTFTEDNKTLKVPVSIRLTATVVESSVLAHILSAGSRDFTLGERFHRWRSGELRLISDLILGADILDEERKILAKDKTGAMSEIIRRRTKSTAGTVMSGDVSVGTASNLLVVSQQTVSDVERTTGQKISNIQFREKLFGSTYVMMIVVVDTENELATFYTRGQSVSSRYAVRELKLANKGSGPDISEIIKAFQLGNSVSL